MDEQAGQLDSIFHICNIDVYWTADAEATPQQVIQGFGKYNSRQLGRATCWIFGSALDVVVKLVIYFSQLFQSSDSKFRTLEELAKLSSPFAIFADQPRFTRYYESKQL